jgi:hypothetical protein
MTAPDPLRCACPACLKLDRRWPRDGYQLQLPTNRQPQSHSAILRRQQEARP